MPATAPSTLQRLGLGDFDHEMASTRRILARVPDEHFDWRPHAKSGTLGTLASLWLFADLKPAGELVATLWTG